MGYYFCKTIWDFLQRRMVDKIAKAILLTSSKIVKDTYWQSVLANAANGNMPQYFSLQKDRVIFNKKKKRLEFNLRINTDLVVQAEDLIDFFRKNGGIYSGTDNEWVAPSCPTFTWSDIVRRPKLMEHAVFIYTRTVCRHIGISDAQRQLLQARIIFGIRSGQIHTVKYIDSIITEIPQLHYNTNDQQFTIDGRVDLNMLNGTYIDPRIKIKKRG